MKISTDKEELKNLKICQSGYKTFIDAHGDNTVTLSQCLESNGWADTWWLIARTYDQFSNNQKQDLRLLACDYALLCIDNFEKEYPKDNRPRLAIEASIAFAKGRINSEELSIAESAASVSQSAAELAAGLISRSTELVSRSAESAVWAARSTTDSASRSTIDSVAAASAARSAAQSIVWSAAESTAAWAAAELLNTEMMMDLFIKWETQFNNNSK